MSETVLIAQAAVDILAWLLLPFATVLVVEWVIRLFRRD